MKGLRRLLRKADPLPQPAIRILKRLNGSAKGQIGFLIGNGPSLRFEDLDALKRQTTFASNKVYLAFGQTRFRPTFYAATDLPCIPEAQENMLRSTETTCFFPTYAPRHPKLRAHYFDLLPFEEPTPTFYSDLRNGFGSAPTVSFFHMQLAYTMGISTLFLVGCDCNYQTNHEPTDSNEYVIHTDQNNYFIDGYHTQGEKIAKVNVDGQTASFEVAKQAWESDGRRILNATRGGDLEVFSRVDLDEVLENISQ